MGSMGEVLDRDGLQVALNGRGGHYFILVFLSSFHSRKCPLFGKGRAFLAHGKALAKVIGSWDGP